MHLFLQSSLTGTLAIVIAGCLVQTESVIQLTLNFRMTKIVVLQQIRISFQGAQFASADMSSVANRRQSYSIIDADITAEFHVSYGNS
jgi:hypothetical protein